MDDPGVLLALVVVATAAGFVDAIAGGGGLIIVPALMMAQVPGVQALATNKVQSMFGTLSASWVMILAGQVSPGRLWKEIAACFAGAALGTAVLKLARPEYLEIAIPLVIAVICGCFLLSPNLGRVKAKPRVSRRVWRLFCLPSLGFYDGYFGPGAGMFYQLGQVAMRGYTVVQATARAKLLNFASNTAALVVFIGGGDVVWSVGLAMGAGQAIGGFLGARTAITRGYRLIRATIVAVCLGMLVKLIWDLVAVQ